MGVPTPGRHVLALRGQDLSALHRGALLDGLLLASTAGVAKGLALQVAAPSPFALDAALFFISHRLIAASVQPARVPPRR